MNIGNKILELRKKNNLSQEQLAEKLNVTRQTISKWELNETTPDLKQAQELSMIFKISLDDLTNNDIQSIVLEKISNTEKLAGILIKILKSIGVILIGFTVIMIFFFILFTTFKRQPNETSLKSVSLNCSIEENDYVISVGDETYFNCANCTKQMEVYLKDITDWANIENSIKNIKKYFSDNGGVCKEIEK